MRLSLSTLAISFALTVGTTDIVSSPQKEFHLQSEDQIRELPLEQEVSEFYLVWRNRYVTAEGANGALRVQRTENDYDTVSEGIAYGMLASVYHTDKITFDGLWQFAKNHMNDNGLMHWRISAQNQIIGYNGATDADEDMAFALIVAENRFKESRYGEEARILIDRIFRHEIESGSNIVKAGDVWGGAQITNPSYFAPGYYKLFAVYTQNAKWLEIVDANYRVLDKVSDHVKNQRGRPTGLFPDWCNSEGRETSDMGYHFKYDAFRTPWRLAKDFVWFGDERARRHLESLNSFIKEIGPTNIKDGYQIDGTVIGQWHNAAIMAPIATASLTSDDAEFKEVMIQEARLAHSNNYYNDSLRLLSLMLISGKLAIPNQLID
jgi:endo-1,4-beta-D-glucanase Y